MKTEDILDEREKTHGDFEQVSFLHNMLVEFMRNQIDHRKKERGGIKQTHFFALQMISLKIARILCGDPNFDDHWDDIAGYAMLGKGENVPRETKEVAEKKGEKDICCFPYYEPCL